ncbi:MAG: redoxin domain-containing protein [Planctomycetota bacterium]
MIVRQLALVTLYLGLVAQACADAPDAVEVLKKAQAAAGKLQAISYEAELDVTGALTRILSPQSGQVTLARSDGMIVRARIDGKKADAGRFELASDGDSVDVIDHDKKQHYQAQGREAYSLLLRSGGLLLGDVLAPKPFAQDADNSGAKYVGLEKIFDVECHVIEVPFSSGKGQARWFFSTSDYLPRRVIRIMPTPEGDASQSLTLKSLNPSPELSDGMFKLAVPSGYESNDRRGSSGRSSHKLLQPDTQAPDWSLPTPDGKKISLKDLRGKIVVLDFWATWCVPCKAAMPGVQKIHEKYKDKPVAVYGVSTWERGRADPAGYMKSKKFTYGLLLKGEKVAQEYKIKGIPTFYVIGHDGNIIYANSGMGNDAQIEEAIEEGLKRIK